MLILELYERIVRMTKEEEKDKLNNDNLSNTDSQTKNISFFNRLKQQVKTLNLRMRSKRLLMKI